jgi:hypothetical protein
MKRFCYDAGMCRRKALLSYFGEENTSFGLHCGTCDVCQARCHSPLNVTERDFAYEGARIILTVVDGLRQQSLSQITKALSGNAVLESFRYRSRVDENTLNHRIQEEKQRVQTQKKLTKNYYKDLIPLLVQKGYLSEQPLSVSHTGFQRTWTGFSITPLGTQALKDESYSIMLPIPLSILEQERLEALRPKKTVRASTTKKHISRETIPHTPGLDDEAIAPKSALLASLDRYKDIT